MNNRTRVRGLIFPLLAALSLLLAGCGGVALQEDPGTANNAAASPTGPETTTNAAASPTGPETTTDATPAGAAGATTTCLIGAPHPLSGPWAENGQNSVRGMELAAEEINRNGGIAALGGANIEIVPGDTATDPAQAQSVTAQLVTDRGVSALVGSYLSSLTLTSSTAAESQRVPMVSQSFVDELTQRGYEYFFQLPPKSSSFGANTVSYYLEIAEAKGRPVQNAVVFGSNDAATRAQADRVVQAATEQGINIPEPVVFPPGITDASAIVNQIAASNPDVIFAGGPVADIVLIIRDLRARGIQVPIVGTGGTGFLVKGLAEGLGDQVNGIMSLSAWNEDMNLPEAQVQEASEAYREAYNEPFMPQEAGETYVAVHLIKAAIEQAGSCEPQDIRDALAQMEVSSGPESAMPPGQIAFDDTGMNSFATPVMIQWQDQVPRTVWPQDVAATEVQLLEE
jgi:branched-chain amino acid transport system substrate-binding protein